MPVNISTEAKNAAGTAINDLLNSGSTYENPTLEIRTGTKPTNPQSVATGTLLATLSLSNPAFMVFTNGTATANPISPDVNIDDDGQAGWFRCYNRDGVPVFDGDITGIGGGGNVEFDNVDFLKGGTVQITSLVARFKNCAT